MQCRNIFVLGGEAQWALVDFSDSEPGLRVFDGEKFVACSAEGTHCQPVLACCFMKCLLLKSIKC